MKDIDKELAFLNELEEPVDDEDRFKESVRVVQNAIQLKISAAKKIIAEAYSISDKYGIPFEPQINEGYEPYIPNSFYEKWKMIPIEVAASELSISKSSIEDGK